METSGTRKWRKAYRAIGKSENILSQLIHTNIHLSTFHFLSTISVYLLNMPKKPAGENSKKAAGNARVSIRASSPPPRTFSVPRNDELFDFRRTQLLMMIDLIVLLVNNMFVK